MTPKRFFILSILWLFAACRAHADAALLLEEPYGGFGELTPTGHAAVYLTRICATTPTLLRRCSPEEAGVVISRYYNVSGYDWIAIPLAAYLYAVDDPAEIPAWADTKLADYLRDRYRRLRLRSLVPDDPRGATPGGEWTELVGESYRRKIYGFQIETSEAQDDQLIEELNQRPNRRSWRPLPAFLLSRNCADFARGIFNFYHPHSVHRNFVADAGITTPKQVGKSLAQFAGRHPELRFSSFVFPQVSGSIRRSRRVNGVAEAVVRSKKYLAPMLILHPIITGSIALMFLGEGRFSPARQVGRLPASPEIAAVRERWRENVLAATQSESVKEKPLPAVE